MSLPHPALSVSQYLRSGTQQCGRLQVRQRRMPICISCSTPVKNLYTTYSKADDRSLGKGVRLTQCPRCKRFADKYVEHDFVVLFIDLVLIKPQVGDVSIDFRGSGIIAQAHCTDSAATRSTAICCSTASAALTIRLIPRFSVSARFWSSSMST